MKQGQAQLHGSGNKSGLGGAREPPWGSEDETPAYGESMKSKWHLEKLGVSFRNPQTGQPTAKRQIMPSQGLTHVPSIQLNHHVLLIVNDLRDLALGFPRSSPTRLLLRCTSALRSRPARSREAKCLL
jgi:hypothetical protein